MKTKDMFGVMTVDIKQGSSHFDSNIIPISDWLFNFWLLEKTGSSDIPDSCYFHRQECRVLVDGTRIPFHSAVG